MSTTEAAATADVVDAAPTAAPVSPPSVHVRAAATWITIFPLVAIGMTLMAGITEGWHPVLRALVLTLIVVPLAVYIVVPRVLGLYGHLRNRAR